MPSLWCLVYLGFMKKNGRLEGSVLDECGKKMESKWSEGMPLAKVCFVYSCSLEGSIISTQLCLCWALSPGDWKLWPSMPGSGMDLLLWLQNEECLPDPYQLLEIFYPNWGWWEKSTPCENLPSQCFASVSLIFSPKWCSQNQAAPCSFLNTHPTFSHTLAHFKNIASDDLLWVSLRLCLPVSKPSSHCQVPQLICEWIRAPHILTHFKTLCPSLIKYSV